MKTSVGKNLSVGIALGTMLLLGRPSDAKEPLTIPFVHDHHRVIIPTSVNGSRPLELILDTGMGFDGVYLFHSEFTAIMDTAGAIEVRVPGAGAGDASTAVMMESGQLHFGDVVIDSQRVIISGSEHTQGFPTDGIIGWSILGHYIVEIDYDQEQLLLHDSSFVPDDTNWVVMPIEIIKNLPWLELEVEVVEGEPILMCAYIDLAAEDVLQLLTREDQRYTLPDSLQASYLGTGLSGDINGSKGKSFRVRMAEFEIHDIATSFAPAAVRSKQDGADGILGNGFIENFNVIFDYYRERMYLRPNGLGRSKVTLVTSSGTDQPQYEMK